MKAWHGSASYGERSSAESKAAIRNYLTRQPFHRKVSQLYTPFINLILVQRAKIPSLSQGALR